MTTPEKLREEARAADELADLVSYAADKRSLHEQAEGLRRKAAQLEQDDPSSPT